MNGQNKRDQAFNSLNTILFYSVLRFFLVYICQAYQHTTIECEFMVLMCLYYTISKREGEIEIDRVNQYTLHTYTHTPCVYEQVI